MKREEFEISLLKPITFWGTKSKDEVQELLGSDVARMVNYDQRNPHHKYDLFTHTLYVVAGLPLSVSPLLRTAAFFHDIGKPEVAQEKYGNLVFHNHARKSVDTAVPILKQLQYTEDELNIICFYIHYHDAFISWILPSEKATSPHQMEITQENVQKHLEKIMHENEVFQLVSEEEIWKNLMLLDEADVCAQADKVYRDGALIDSKEHKMQKNELISDYIHEIISSHSSGQRYKAHG